MSDLGEIFNEMKAQSKQRRAHNSAQSPKLLELDGIGFVSKNNGAHLIVEGAGRVIDFWPGTGKWIERGGAKGRGVRPLIAYIKSLVLYYPLVYEGGSGLRCFVSPLPGAAPINHRRET